MSKLGEINPNYTPEEARVLEERPSPHQKPSDPPRRTSAMDRVAGVLNETAGFEVGWLQPQVRDRLLSRLVQAVADVVVDPDPPSRRPRCGDVVRLRSGGCTMTLIDLDPSRVDLEDGTNSADDPECTVVWTTVDGQGGQLVVPRSCLIRVDLAAEEAAAIERYGQPSTGVLR